MGDGREGDSDHTDGRHDQATGAGWGSKTVPARLGRRRGRGRCGVVGACLGMRRLIGESGRATQLPHNDNRDAERHRRDGDGQVRRVARLLALHALARGAQLPRPETGGWWRNPGLRLRAGGQPAVALVHLRPTVLQAPTAGRRPADPRRAATGARPDAAHLAVHAGARHLGLPRSDPFSPVEPGRLQPDTQQRCRVAGGPRLDRRPIAGVRAGSGRLQLLSAPAATGPAPAAVRAADRHCDLPPGRCLLGSGANRAFERQQRVAVYGCPRHPSTLTARRYS